MVRKLLLQIVMIVGIVTAVPSCVDKVIQRDHATTNKIFTLQEEEAKQIFHEGRYVLTIQIDSLTDSRCPVQAKCSSAGAANLLLQVNGVQELSQQLELCIGGACLETPNRIRVTVDNTSWEIRLMDVTPYPEVGVQSPIKTVFLLISE